MAKNDTTFGVLFPTVVCSTSIFFISYIPIVGSALQLMTPTTLPFFGSASIESALSAMALFCAAFAIHRQVDGDEDTRTSAAVSLLLSTIGVGVMHCFTQHVKSIAMLAAYASGYAAVGLAVQLIWILGAPIAMGCAHYWLNRKDPDAKIVDSMYLTFSLMAAATAGWYTENWKALNPFYQGSSFTHYISKIAPAISTKDATIELIAGQLFTKASLFFIATRGLCPSMGSPSERKSKLEKTGS